MDELDRIIRERFWHWENAVDSLDDVLLLVEKGRRVTRANQAIENWGLGDVKSAPKKDFHDLLHPNCQNSLCYLDNLWYRMSRYTGGKGRVEQEVRDDHLNRWVHVSIEPLQPPSDKHFPGVSVPFALFILRDKTELRRQKEMDDRKTRFEAFHLILRGLAHEIGNPLAAMRTSLEVLCESMDRFPPEKVSVYLNRILEGTERLQGIVDRTLKSQYLPELNLEPVPLVTLLGRMQRLFEDNMAAYGINFQVDLPSDTSPMLILDLNSAEEVLVNLLKNAREACRSNDRVHLGYTVEENEANILVEDTGKGMDEDQVHSLFLPFFTTKAGGLGIGLAYSNYLMNKMGGSISIDSEISRGTRVKLRFRRGDEDHENG